MKFFEILTQYDLQLEDGSYDELADTMFLTEDEYNDDLLKELADSASREGMKVRAMNVKEITSEEFSEKCQERIIKEIIPGIYRKSLNLPEDISIREYAELCSDPMHQASALRQFEIKYHIYTMLLRDLDLSKVSVSELLDKIEKLYAARLKEEFPTFYEETIKK